MGIRNNRLFFVMPFCAVASAGLFADDIVTTNVEFNITEPTVLSGVTNAYTFGYASDSPMYGTIAADLTIQNRSWVRLTGGMINTKPTDLYIAPGANAVTVDVSGHSTFLTSYRNPANRSDAWNALGIDPTDKKVKVSYMSVRLGQPDGAADSTGAAKIRLADKADSYYGNNTDGTLCAWKFYVESSVSTNGPGTVDFLEITDSAIADIGILYQNNPHPARILFRNGGKYLHSNPTCYYTATPHTAFAPGAGKTLILESADGSEIYFWRKLGESQLTAGLGGTVVFRGDCDVRIYRDGAGDNLDKMHLGNDDTILWEHTGDLIFDMNVWLVLERNDQLPFGPGTGGVQFTAYNPPEFVSFMDINGTTQRVNSLTAPLGSRGDGTVAYVTNSLAGTAPGLLRFGTCNDNGTFQMPCREGVEAVKEGTGTLTMKNMEIGDFGLLGGALGFDGTVTISNLAVSAGTRADGSVAIKGTLAFAGTDEDRNFKNMSVALGAGAKISVPAGSVFTVYSVTCDGVHVDAGVYAAGETSWVEGGSVRVLINETVPTADVTWTGGGATDDATLAGNWSTAPDAPDFSVIAYRPVFATAGTSAAFPAGDNYFVGALFSAPGDFTVSGAAGSKICIYGDVAAAAGDGSARSYGISAPAELNSTIEVDVPENKTLAFSGGISGVAGLGGIVFKGVQQSDMIYDYVGGTLVLSNATFSGPIAHTNGGFLVLHGQVGSPGDTSKLVIRNGDYRDGEHYATGWVELGNTLLDNVTVHKPVALTSPGMVTGATNNENWLRTTEGSTNVFNELVSFGASMEMNLGTNSVAILEKGVAGAKNGSVTLGAVLGATNATYILNGPVQMSATSTKQFGGGSESRNAGVPTLVFDHQGSVCNRLHGGYATYDFRQDNVFSTIDRIILDTYYSRFNFNGTRQSFPLVYCSRTRQAKYYPVFTGDEGSLLEITAGPAVDATDSTTNFHAMITGSLSLKMSGDGYMRLHGRAHSTTGNVEVSAGTIYMTPNCTWLNGKKVVLSGTGTLKTDAAAFGEQVVLETEGDNWSYDIAEGVTQKASAFFNDGIRRKHGRWGSLESDAENKSARFTGAGYLLVRRVTMAVSFR